jgi:DMSO/TMAO reductase YedYZ molybdopterin-dependent catalytic subunit
MGVADLLAWLVAPSAAPLTAVGSTLIDLFPAWLVNWGKETLGTADKPVLLTGTVVGVLVLCGIGGQLELRRRYAGAAVFGLVALIGAVAVLTRERWQVQSVIPTLLGLLVGYLVLHLLIARLRRTEQAAAELVQTSPPSRPDPRHGAAAVPPAVDLSGPVAVQRRGFLRAAVLVGAAGAVTAIAGRALVSAAGRIAEARAKLQLPDPARRAPAPPPGADFGVPELSPYVTPNADFYRIDTALQVPVINPADWKLTVTGMVRNEITLTFAELLARPLVEHMTTLTCVSNPVGGNLVGNAMWLGLPIRELLAQAGPDPDADMVLSRSHDGWTAGTPLSALTDPDRQALLAVGMNGAALPVEHGFPVRMVVPGLYGYVSATKWVTELKVTTFDDDQGYWTPLGWSARGPIKLASRIDVPSRPNVETGSVVVAGVAWAQHTGIAKVQLRIDDGDWRECELAEVTGPDTWRQWRYSWTATPGEHRITVRATDADGNVQTDEIAPPAPNGASGWHTITVRVREV